jgi:lipoate-protein ligase B
MQALHVLQQDSGERYSLHAQHVVMALGHSARDSFTMLHRHGVAMTAKAFSIGVRIERGRSLHGIALNVDPDLSHFGLIVPCGLHGRAVTSMRREVGAACPVLEDASTRLGEEIAAALTRPSAKAP